MSKSIRRLTCLMLVLSVMSAPAHAGIPVIDTANLVQAIQEVLAWGQQLQQMLRQVQQAQAQYAAITGGRGMETLLQVPTEARNYLPPDYQQLADVLDDASAQYQSLSRQLTRIVNQQRVLNDRDIDLLSPLAREAIRRGRNSGALLQLVAEQAQAHQSERFEDLQELIDAIGTASDDKAIQDLQGRITAEQAMLTTEQTKLQALYQLANAAEIERAQRAREGALAQLGRQADLPALDW